MNFILKRIFEEAIKSDLKALEKRITVLEENRQYSNKCIDENKTDTKQLLERIHKLEQNVSNLETIVENYKDFVSNILSNFK